MSNPAWLYLGVTVANLAAGGYLLWRAFEVNPNGAPPLLAFVAIGLAALALLAAPMADRRRLTADEEQRATVSGWWSAVSRGRRFLALMIAFLLAAYLLNRLPVMPAGASYNGLVLTWLLSFGLFTWAMTPARPGQRRDWLALWRSHRRTILGIAALAIVALALRTWRLGSIPFNLSGDEASQGLESLKVVRGELRNPFATGWLSVPTMSFFYGSLAIRFTGPTIAGLRLPWTLLGAATVILAFFLVRRLQGERLAWVTAALLAVYHFHIHFSRLGSPQVADPFFVTLALLLLYRALDTGDVRAWAFGGAVGGLAFYFYAGARFTPILVAGIVTVLGLTGGRAFWRRHTYGLVVWLGAFLLIGGPMFQVALRFPDEFNARLNQVGIIQSGWLVREVEIRGESTAVILFDQFRRAVLAFNFYPDRTVWYGLRRPLLDPLFGALFLVGLAYGTGRIFDRRPETKDQGPKTKDESLVLRPWSLVSGQGRLIPFVAWWWGGMLLGGMMTESPPSSMRLISLAVPACFFIALAMEKLIRLGRTIVPRLPAGPLLAAGVALFAVISLRGYFVEFTPQRIAGGGHAEIATAIAPLLRDLAPTHDIYFLGAPQMYWGFATLPYLVPNAQARDVTDPLTPEAAAEVVMAGRGAVFVFLPHQLGELALVQQALPNGEIIEMKRTMDGRVLATVYVVDG